MQVMIFDFAGAYFMDISEGKVGNRDLMKKGLASRNRKRNFTNCTGKPKSAHSRKNEDIVGLTKGMSNRYGGKTYERKTT